jgi:5'-nucleotidase
LNTYRRPDFGPAAAFAARLARAMLAAPPTPGVLLNVNVPAIPAAEIRGVKLTRQSRFVLDDRYEERFDPRGRRYFWLAAERMAGPAPAPDDDTSALADGFISITPLRYDLTDDAARERLSPWLASLNR